MLAHERFQRIVELVARHQKIGVGALQTELSISPATLRRDLAELESLGKIVRVRGAVVHPTVFRGEPSFEQKRRRAAPVKRLLARAAALLVPPKATIWVDAGTTCLEVGSLLLARRDVTILTPSIALATRAVENGDGARVIVTGGEVRAISGALVGAFALDWTINLRADWGFLGASGLDESGASTTEMSEAAQKTAILGRCEHRVLLCDVAKWGRPATVRFAPWSKFDFWVTNPDVAPEIVAKVEKSGPCMVLAAGDEK